MRCVPVVAVAVVGHQRHLEAVDPAHAHRQFGRQGFDPRGRHLEHQFVVHLHDHAHLGRVRVQPGLYVDHRQLDQVRRGALQRRVDGGAFGVAALGLVLRLDVGQVQAPSEQGASAMDKKIVNDAVAYIQSLAQLRGRNAEWAEKSVREGASLAAEDALELGVVDLLAECLEELLKQALKTLMK